MHMEFFVGIVEMVRSISKYQIKQSVTSYN
jgi:hypothetical protein